MRYLLTKKQKLLLLSGEKLKVRGMKTVKLDDKLINNLQEFVEFDWYVNIDRKTVEVKLE